MGLETLIYDRIENLFDVIVDGLSITRAKPDPEVFLTAAERLSVDPGTYGPASGNGI